MSRSFYLSLIVLPRAARDQVSLAYLFCRAADTIADTRMLPCAERLQSLETFRQHFQTSSDHPARRDLLQLRDHFISHQGSEGERQLMHHLPECFQLYAELPASDQRLIRDLVATLTQGMEMDLTQFPTEDGEAPRALPDADALDRYTYYVAGVVGAFWTNIHAAHLPHLQRLDLDHMRALGIRFGKGLQLTNVLKDLGSDLRMGRCYLPETYLQAHQLDVSDLRQPDAQERIQPIVHRLVCDTLDHLDHAREYICQLPMRPVRLRLSCMWPLLFALQTLEVICTSTTLLEPDAKVKISRQAVYRTMLNSLWCLLSRRGFERYYDRLRHRVQCILS
ncbi:MAG: squalene/phytoene synthase family protein [Candidatus Tectomicrobia bacterium]|nr:squalene/phytoene synthase family protein [Candidatus Tectomicrobia bacterium]